MDLFVKCDVETMVYDLLRMIHECHNRCLRNSAMWAAELYSALRKSHPNIVVNPVKVRRYYMTDTEIPTFLIARCYFEAQQYDRAVYYSKDCECPSSRFLNYYARYFAAEKKRLDDVSDGSFHTAQKGVCHSLQVLMKLFRQESDICMLDGYSFYLYGVLLKKLQLRKRALKAFIKAVILEPLNWCAWVELSTFISDCKMLRSIILPNHWMRNFFLAHTFLELQMNDLALEIYRRLMDVGFADSTYLLAQTAISYHNMRDLEKAICGFKDLLKIDPYRLDNLDIYSNLLYVREMKSELSSLAHKACNIDKYRVETCCVIGNFYSLRTQHEMAVLYFQRALQLNPNCLSAWTLMGHEYMEMKNISFAIQAYRQAIEVNHRDYRAWYGLGQTYEILKMPFYCLYYYKQAQQLRPHDSRMIVALGEGYEKLDKHLEAKKCYWKAHIVGDIEGTALMKLARLYEKLNDDARAAAAYTDYIKEVRGDNETGETWQAYLFLAKHHYKKMNLEKSHEYAQQCTQFTEAKEDGKVLLRQIASRRAIMEEKANSSAQQSQSGEAGTTTSPVDSATTL